MSVQEQTPSAEAFTRYWTDMMSRMGGGFPSPGAAMPESMAKQMQQAFMEAWARYCDEYMRSEQFLETMKQNMDNALAFRGQVDEFLKQALGNSHISSSEDVDDVVSLVRAVEERILARLEALEAKMGRGGIGRQATGSVSRPPEARAPKGVRSSKKATARSGGSRKKSRVRGPRRKR